MSKRKALNMDVLQQSANPHNEPLRKVEAKAEGKAPSRVGKVQIGAHVTPEIRTRLKMASLETGQSVNALILEGIETVLTKHGK